MNFYILENQNYRMSLLSFRFKVKIHLIGIFILIFGFSLAQKKDRDSLKIDSLIALTVKYNKSYETAKLLDVSKNLLIISKKPNNDRGLAIGNFFIAYCLSNSGNYIQSNNYLKKAETFTTYFNKNKTFAASTFILEGINYQKLGFYTLSAKSFHSALNIYKKVPKEKEKEMEPYERNVYAVLGNLYNATKKQDSAYYYINKKKYVSFNGDYADRAFLFNGLGDYHLNDKNQDSADYYYRTSLQQFGNQENHYYKSDAMRGLGNVLAEQKKYPEALAYYLRALESYKKMNLLNNEYELYRSIGEVYNKTENYKQGKYYLERYVALKDSIETAQEKEGDFIISEVMKAEKEQQESRRKEDLKKAVFIIATILVLLLILFYYFKKARDKNKQIIIKSKELLQKKEEIIIQKSEETQDLRLKVNESFEGIVQLAKENNPEFLTRFQEIYPEFTDKLKEISPEINSEDLRFCALLKLNFSTKDIAEYTFVTVRTVQTRKSRLRKKFNIPSDEDIYLWMNELR